MTKFGWGDYEYVLDMFRRGQLVPAMKSNLSNCSFVYGSSHSDFSDVFMISPVWLAKAVGVAGGRSPHETAEEIADHTFHFLNEVMKKQEKEVK